MILRLQAPSGEIRREGCLSGLKEWQGRGGWWQRGRRAGDERGRRLGGYGTR